MARVAVWVPLSKSRGASGTLLVTLDFDHSPSLRGHSPVLSRVHSAVATGREMYFSEPVSQSNNVPRGTFAQKWNTFGPEEETCGREIVSQRRDDTASAPCPERKNHKGSDANQRLKANDCARYGPGSQPSCAQAKGKCTQLRRLYAKDSPRNRGQGNADQRAVFAMVRQDARTGIEFEGEGRIEDDRTDE